MSELWRKLYERHGYQPVEPLEYLPIPGSIKIAHMRMFAEKDPPPEPKCICEVDEDEMDLWPN